MGNLAIRVEQMVKTVIGRGDSTVLRLAKLARPLSVPLRQLILLCSQKLHEQLKPTNKEKQNEEKHTYNSGFHIEEV